MTRTEKLWSMTGSQLIAVAENLGVKLNKKGNSLKESKEKAIQKILAAEAVEETETFEDVQEVEEETAGEIVGAMTTPETSPKAEEKKERKPRTKKVMQADIIELLAYIESTWKEMGIIRAPEKEGAMFKALCAKNGRQVLKLMWTTKKVSLFTRVEAAVDFAESWQKINYAMPFQCMFYHDTEDTRQNIRNLMEMVYAADAVRITKKMMKEQEKAKKTA